jgi:hypothetical protein
MAQAPPPHTRLHTRPFTLMALPADVLATIAAHGDAGTRGALGFASPAAGAARPD